MWIHYFSKRSHKHSLHNLTKCLKHDKRWIVTSEMNHGQQHTQLIHLLFGSKTSSIEHVKRYPGERKRAFYIIYPSDITTKVMTPWIACEALSLKNKFKSSAWFLLDEYIFPCHLICRWPTVLAEWGINRIMNIVQWDNVSEQSCNQFHSTYSSFANAMVKSWDIWSILFIQLDDFDDQSSPLEAWHGSG